MNRYYICRRLGTGVPLDPYYSELRQYAFDTYGIRPKHQIIAHTFEWCLIKYDVVPPRHNNFVANVVGLYVFPAGDLDRVLSSLTPAVRSAIRGQLTTMGLATQWIDNEINSIRDVIQFVAHSIQLSEQCEVVGAMPNGRPNAADFNLRGLTVAGLRLAVHIEAIPRILERMELMGIDTAWVQETTPIWRLVRRMQRHADDVTPRLQRNGKRWFYHDSEPD